MIKALLAMGTRATTARVRRVIGLAALNGLAQGAALACLVPISIALLHGDMHLLWTWLLVLALACIVTAVFVVTSTMGSFDISLDVMEDMHLGLGHRMVRLPLGWFSASATARASNIVVRGTMFVAGATTDALAPVVISVTTPIAVAIVILAFDWRIGLALLAGMVVILFVSRLSNKANKASEDLVHSTTLETDKRLLEFADDQVTLRSAGLRGSQYQPLARAIEERRKAGRKSVLASIIAMIPLGFAIDICFSLVIALAVLRAISAEADPVAMIALVALATQVSGPLRVISELMTTLRRAEFELGEVNDVLGTPGMITPEISTGDVADNTVQLDDVHFSYDADHPVLDGVDLTLPAGKVTALVGPSGSGKTTVTRLIARFWDPDSGRVSIGGVDVRELSDEDRMAQLSLVFQDSYLFDESLWQNVALGNESASREQVLRAADLAQVTAIAERFPSGWYTRVGQGGSLLSGGERQRVSIARAFVKDAPVLLLDEAAAALDPIMANTIQAALEHFRGRATILIIAHQADTIANADSIAFLDDGRITAQGTHIELLETNPRYAAFWQGRIAAEQWHIGADTNQIQRM